MAVGDWIRAARAAAGLTVVELAGLVDVHRETVRNWEQGLTSPSSDALAAAAAALGCPAAHLLEGPPSFDDVLALERAWAGWNGLDDAVACGSGTAALHLALEAVAGGRTVAVPDYAMVSCARAVTMAGADVALVACDEYGLADIDALDSALAETGAAAAMAVHTYGRRVDMDQFHAVASKHGAAVVEDLAEAHGVRPHESTHAACWSFYRNKIVAGEEGGAVAFRDAEHAAAARTMRCVGMRDGYSCAPRGCNYRIAPTLARLVLGSVAQYARNLEARRRGEAAYDAALEGAYKDGRLTRMPPRVAPWVYDVLVPGCAADAVKRLHRAGIPARPGFVPMHLQEEYCGSRVHGDPAHGERLCRRLLYLPLPGDAAAAASALLA